MNKLMLPAHCEAISAEEERALSGGGELSSALGDFFSNFHLADFFWGTAFVAVSFTFVPLMLTKVLKAAFDFATNFSDDLAAQLDLSSESAETLKKLSSR